MSGVPTGCGRYWLAAIEAREHGHLSGHSAVRHACCHGTGACAPPPAKQGEGAGARGHLTPIVSVTWTTMLQSTAPNSLLPSPASHPSDHAAGNDEFVTALHPDSGHDGAWNAPAVVPGSVRKRARGR